MAHKLRFNSLDGSSRKDDGHVNNIVGELRGTVLKYSQWMTAMYKQKHACTSFCISKLQRELGCFSHNRMLIKDDTVISLNSTNSVSKGGHTYQLRRLSARPYLVVEAVLTRAYSVIDCPVY